MKKITRLVILDSLIMTFFVLLILHFSPGCGRASFQSVKIKKEPEKKTYQCINVNDKNDTFIHEVSNVQP